MNYAAAIDFLLSRTDYERWPGYQYAIRFDLRRMDELLQRLSNPHLSARTVHIAGSKGKGSTAAMIASGLRAAGNRTGLYTSPHLITLRERINVDGKPILKRDLVKAVKRLQPEADASDRDCLYGVLSTFELLTAAAFVHFQTQEVDYQVLETGLGGRLDATNVVAPEVCVITSISLDHTDVLGNTIAEIAGEKAGIIKPGVPVVISKQEEQAATVFREACAQKKSPLREVGGEFKWNMISADLSGQTLEVRGGKADYLVTIPLLGEHQIRNAVTAIAALEILGLSQSDIESGLAHTEWPGRLQVLKRRPLMIADGAHTVDSLIKLKHALQQYFHFDKLIFIIGTSSDKDLAGVAAEVALVAHSVIATRSRHPRATNPRVVADEFTRNGVQAEIADNVALAVKRAQDIAGNRDLICATGSLFLVGEMIECIKGLRPEPYPL